MNNNSIGQVLRYYRKLNKLSVEEVSKFLEKNNYPAATKTIYGWENNHTQPNAETLMLLCNLYKIPNILEAFGYEDNNNRTNIILTEHEELLVIRYREHPDLQKAIDLILQISNDFE